MDGQFGAKIANIYNPQLLFGLCFCNIAGRTLVNIKEQHVDICGSFYG